MGFSGTGFWRCGVSSSGCRFWGFAVRGFALRVRGFPLGVRGFGGLEFQVQGYPVQGFWRFEDSGTGFQGSEFVVSGVGFLGLGLEGRAY